MSIYNNSKCAEHACTYVHMTYVISPIVLAIVRLVLVLHCPLLTVTVVAYSVLGLRPVIVHGLVVHSAQPGDGGVQLTEVVMSLGSLGWVHFRVTVSHGFSYSTYLKHLNSSLQYHEFGNTSDHGYSVMARMIVHYE